MTDKQSNRVEIVDLRIRPDLRSAVVEQNVEQWGAFTGIAPPQMESLFVTDNPPETLPTTLVAVVDGRYAGCVSLRRVTMGALTHPEIYTDDAPWLSNMWVADWARGHGVASTLTEAVEALARQLGFTTIFSSTGTADSLYHRRGFTTFDTRAYKSETIHLISKPLS
jgi:GNAT superfamily N-acetyltransferase